MAACAVVGRHVNLQRPLPDSSLQVVLRGEKQDGAMDLVNPGRPRQHASCERDSIAASRWDAGSNR